MNTLPALNSLPSFSDSSTSLGTTVAIVAASTAADAVLPGSGFLLGGLPLTRIILVVLGLLLFAAGIFSFEKTREIISTTTEKAGQVAKVAAVAA